MHSFQAFMSHIRPWVALGFQDWRLWQWSLIYNFITSLQPTDFDYLDAQTSFINGWANQERALPTIRAIYRVEHRGQLASAHMNQWFQYRSNLRSQNTRGSAVDQVLFQGLTRACSIGEVGVTTSCNEPGCALCHVLRCDFVDGHHRKVGYWGRGIYTTTASNKADHFANNTSSQSRCGVVLLHKVLVGKRAELGYKDTNLRQPPIGYNSVDALTSDQGGVVKYSEVIVYRDDAILPWIMIVYNI